MTDKPRVVVGDTVWAVFREAEPDLVEMTTIPTWAASAIYQSGQNHDERKNKVTRWVAAYNKLSKECVCSHQRQVHMNYLGQIGGHGLGYQCSICECKNFRLPQ